MRLIALLASLALVYAKDAGYFWYNLNTGESSNSLPACVGIKDPKNGDRAYWIHGDKPTWVPTEECAWSAANTTDKTVQTYYFNSESKAVQWERPDSLSWVKMTKDESKKFYVNSQTKETVRQIPPVLGHQDKARGATYYLDSKGNPSWDVPVEAQARGPAS